MNWKEKELAHITENSYSYIFKNVHMYVNVCIYLYNILKKMEKK